MNEADLIISALEMAPLPNEGGFFVQTYKSKEIFNIKNFSGNVNPRASSTAIYYLLKSNDFSALHKLASDELWHFYAGDPITLVTITEQGICKESYVGSDIFSGQYPQFLIAKNTWFGAYINLRHINKGYSLLGCTVSPGFEDTDLELGTRKKLIGLFPELATMVTRLTRY